MKEFRNLKNGGLFKLENHSSHNHLSTFLTLLNLAEFKKSQAFTNCILPYCEDKTICVKDFIQKDMMSTNHGNLENLFKIKNAQKLFELINFRIDENASLHTLSTTDLNMLSLIKALVSGTNKPLFLYFEKECSFAQNVITRILSFIENSCELNSLSVFICGESPSVFHGKFKYLITRANNGNFHIEKAQTEQIQDLNESKITA